MMKQVQQEIIESYQQEVVKAEPEDLSAQKEAAREYNAQLAQGTAPLMDPFSSTESEQSSEYNSLLNLEGNGMMGSIIIPKINVNIPIYHGLSDEVLQRGAGHVLNTSLPIGGDSSNSVIAAHRGLTATKMFDDLPEVEVDDLIFIKVLDETHTYKVTDIQTVLPTEIDSLKIVPGKDLITLVTCTPYGINTHRIVVRAERTEDRPLEEDQDALHHAGRYIGSLNLRGPLVGLLIVLLVALIVYIIRKRLRRQQRRQALSYYGSLDVGSTYHACENRRSHRRSEAKSYAKHARTPGQVGASHQQEFSFESEQSCGGLSDTYVPKHGKK